MEIDITLEFYSKKANYFSKSTKCSTPIDIKKVVVVIGNRYSPPLTKFCQCLVTSTNGVTYELDDLKF